MNEAGLYVVPKIRRRKRNVPIADPGSWTGMAGHRTQIEYLYHEDGQVKHRVLEWKRPTTLGAVEEVLEDYLARVEAGYKPDGHASPPIPFCARVTRAGRVLVEWTARGAAVRAM